MWSKEFFFRTCVSIFYPYLQMCVWFAEMFLHKIQLKLSKSTIVNGDVSFFFCLLFLCVSPFISVTFRNIPHNLYVTWCALLCGSHTCCYFTLFFINCLTFKFFNCSNCALHTQTHTSTFVCVFFSLYLAVLLFRGHFKCFLQNFNSFSFFYCFVFVFAHLKLNVKNKILCALCIDRSIDHKYGYVLQNRPSHAMCCAFEFEINKILHEDIIWVMKKCDLHFLSMLRVAHTSQFESFDILSMCLLWRRIFFVVVACFALAFTLMQQLIYKHTMVLNKVHNAVI